MSRHQSNAARNDEVEEMATPVQVHPLETTVINSVAVQPAETAPKEWIFSKNRKLGPIVFAGLLIAFYFASPYLPQEFRDFLTSLR